jgi:hypothetical protein
MRPLPLMPFVLLPKLDLFYFVARFLLLAWAILSSTLVLSGPSSLIRSSVFTVFLVLFHCPSSSILLSLRPIAGVQPLRPSSFVLLCLFGVCDARLEWGSVRLRSVQSFPFLFYGLIVFLFSFLYGHLGLVGLFSPYISFLSSFPFDWSSRIIRHTRFSIWLLCKPSADCLAFHFI